MRFTRKDYMDGQCTHREYYAQFVTQSTRTVVAQGITMPTLEASKDEHLNDIALKHWDSLPHRCRDLRLASDYLTAAGWVCIAKEAARQLLDEVESCKQS